MVKTDNYMAIYLGKDTATVLSLASGGTESHTCFSVKAQDPEQANPQALIPLVAAQCSQRKLQPSDIALALDCAMFMQHNIHSEFTDPKQIAATVRFDAEESLAMDVTDLALAFRIISTDQTGSQLTAFTTNKKQLTDIILTLQTGNLDPMTVEPDINSLTQFILRNVELPTDTPSLVCLLSERNCYILAFSKSHQLLLSRTLLVNPAQDKFQLLTRELPMTAALISTEESINHIKLFDSTASVDPTQLSQSLSIEVAALDLLTCADTDPQILTDDTSPLEFAIAYGAALSCQEKTPPVNFRADFLPYQGKKARLEKTIKILSISAVILMLVIGFYLQLRLLQKNRYRSRLRKRFTAQYSAVMFGKKPPAKTNPVKKLAAELRQIRDVRSGRLSITDKQSTSAKLTLILEAFNRTAAQIDLKIKTITISAKTISIAGDTSSRQNTLKLFNALKVAGLEIAQQRLDSKAGRDNFSISVAVK